MEVSVSDVLAFHIITLKSRSGVTILKLAQMSDREVKILNDFNWNYDEKHWSSALPSLQYHTSCPTSHKRVIPTLPQSTEKR